MFYYVNINGACNYFTVVLACRYHVCNITRARLFIHILIVIFIDLIDLYIMLKNDSENNFTIYFKTKQCLSKEVLGTCPSSTV